MEYGLYGNIELPNIIYINVIIKKSATMIKPVAER